MEPPGNDGESARIGTYSSAGSQLGLRKGFEVRYRIWSLCKIILVPAGRRA